MDLDSKEGIALMKRFKDAYDGAGDTAGKPEAVPEEGYEGDWGVIHPRKESPTYAEELELAERYGRKRCVTPEDVPLYTALHQKRGAYLSKEPGYCSFSEGDIPARDAFRWLASREAPFTAQPEAPAPFMCGFAVRGDALMFDVMGVMCPTVYDAIGYIISGCGTTSFHEHPNIHEFTRLLDCDTEFLACALPCAAAFHVWHVPEYSKFAGEGPTPYRDKVTILGIFDHCISPYADNFDAMAERDLSLVDKVSRAFLYPEAVKSFIRWYRVIK